MKLVCLDLEGVLVPEIWIGVAEKTGIRSIHKFPPRAVGLIAAKFDAVKFDRIFAEVMAELLPGIGKVLREEWVSGTALDLFVEGVEGCDESGSGANGIDDAGGRIPVNRPLARLLGAAHQPDHRISAGLEGLHEGAPHQPRRSRHRHLHRHPPSTPLIL